jgi:hypothetical protein
VLGGGATKIGEFNCTAKYATEMGNGFCHYHIPVINKALKRPVAYAVTEFCLEEFKAV